MDGGVEVCSERNCVMNCAKMHYMRLMGFIKYPLSMAIQLIWHVNWTKFMSMYAMQMCTKQHTMPCIRPANGKTLPLFMHTFLPFAYCLFRFVCFFLHFKFLSGKCTTFTITYFHIQWIDWHYCCMFGIHVDSSF